MKQSFNATSASDEKWQVLKLQKIPLLIFYQGGAAYASSQDHPQHLLGPDNAYKSGAEYWAIPCWMLIAFSSQLESAYPP